MKGGKKKSGPRVLVVEEVDTLKRLFEFVLRPVTGPRIYVDTSEAGHSALQNEQIDLLVVEPNLPQCWEVLTAATEAGIPSIVVTSWVDPAFLVAASAAGAATVLTKPFTREDLRAAVASAPVRQLVNG